MAKTKTPLRKIATAKTPTATARGRKIVTAAPSKAKTAGAVRTTAAARKVTSQAPKRGIAKSAPSAPKLKAAEAIALVGRQEKALGKARTQIKELKAELRFSTARTAELETEVELLQKQAAKAAKSAEAAPVKRAALRTPGAKVASAKAEPLEGGETDDVTHRDNGDEQSDDVAEWAKADA